NGNTAPVRKKPKFVPAHIRRKQKAEASRGVYLLPPGSRWRDGWYHIDFEMNERNSTHKELIVLDLNGTLLMRGPRNKDGSRSGFGRPYLGEFLRFALDNFAVMVWSSAQPSSIADMLNKLLAPYCKEFVRVWDRRFCDLDGPYFSKAQSVKDLERIFNGFNLADSPNCDIYGTYDGFTGVDAGSKGKWSLESTIIVDDSESKTALQKDNHIFVSTFNDPLATNKDNSPADSELLKLKNYLEVYTAQKEQYPSLLDYIRAHPWLEFRNTVGQGSAA
ncbi:hypothetical protein LPJ70_002074, partial [Coemansia sp. RSA 2708]